VSSFKLKKIFYESDILPVRNPIYSQYDGQTIDAIIIDDTKSKRRSGGRPSIKGALGIDLETGEEFLLYLGVVRSWSEVLSYIKGNCNYSPPTAKFIINEIIFPIAIVVNKIFHLMDGEDDVHTYSR
jgi:hypothetical protein